MNPSKAPFLSLEPDPLSGCLFETSLKEGATTSRSSAQKQQKSCLNTSIRLTVLLLAIWGSVSLCLGIYHAIWPVVNADVYRPETLERDRNLCDCGNSVQEAISKNCIYDSMAAAWLPPYCRDHELTSEFEVSGPGINGSWPYFADAKGTLPISIAEIAILGDGEKLFWSSRDWHVAHCLFYWEKYTRMRDTGVVMERRFDRDEHTRHCRRLALKKMPNHNLLISVPVMLNSRIVED